MVSLKKQFLSEKCRRFFRKAPILLFYHANSLTLKETRERGEALFSLLSQKKIESLFLKRRVASVVFSDILNETRIGGVGGESQPVELHSLKTFSRLSSSESEESCPSLSLTRKNLDPALSQLFQGPTLCFALFDEADMKQLHHSLLKIRRHPPLLLGSLYRGSLYNALETSHLLSLDSSLSLNLLHALSFPVSRLFWSLKEAKGRPSHLLAGLKTRLCLTLEMIHREAASRDSGHSP